MMREELGRWGLRHVEFDQTGPPPDGADLVWLEAPSNPFLTMPDLEAAAAHPAPCRRRLDRRHARLPAPARARRRLRPALGDEVPDRPLGRARRRDRLTRRRRPSAALAVPPAHGPGLRGGRRRARHARAQDASRPSRAADRDGRRARRAPARASGGRERPLPGLRRAALLRRRRRPGAGRARTAADQERDFARRRRSRRWSRATAGKATACRSGSCACRSASRTRTSSGPTSSRRSRTVG